MAAFVFKPFRRETNYVKRLADEAEHWSKRRIEAIDDGWEPDRIARYEELASDCSALAIDFAQRVAENSAVR